jgi:very-short-patch-repair endonuclease
MSRKLIESKEMLDRARVLRQQASEAENALWKQLRGRRLSGFKFRRQVVIENYIVDFVCLEAWLVIEADGGQHMEQKKYDERRSRFLESKGFKLLRFWNHEILAELNSVLEQVELVLNNPPSPQPSPQGK